MTFTKCRKTLYLNKENYFHSLIILLPVAIHNSFVIYFRFRPSELVLATKTTVAKFQKIKDSYLWEINLTFYRMFREKWCAI